MKIICHKGLTQKQWFSEDIFQQMANVGAEVGRAINWKKKGDLNYCRLAFERVLELLSLTIADKKNVGRLKELTRAREMLIDYFIFSNDYFSTAEFWQKYFLAFNWAARVR